MIDTVFIVIALICFVLAFLDVGEAGGRKFNLIAAGLFFWLLTSLV